MPNDTHPNTDALIRTGLVPYIATWSGEGPAWAPVITKGRSGIGYQHEEPGDRDARGVLWSRYTYALGEGTPEFGNVHPYRQRHAMRRLRCQVCAGPADRNEQGVLYLLGNAGQGCAPDEALGNPPVCFRCARLAHRTCPHLRDTGTLALRVRDAPITAVKGTLYTPGRNGLVSEGPVAVAYDDPLIRWVKAHHLMRRLRDWTMVDLEHERLGQRLP